ncbi:MAG: ATP-binding protein [Lacunisphaera sp.]|nr:ATP-binding protein [Lacunisphaera sp.]
MSATLHLLHGLPGSGKTTYARELAARHAAVCLSPDEWMVERHGSNPPEARFADYKARITAEVWEQAEAHLREGTDVILDSGFWTRAERDDARRRARHIGAGCLLYAFQCDDSVMLQRVLARSQAAPDTALQINEPAFRVFQDRFQPLEADEPHLAIRT